MDGLAIDVASDVATAVRQAGMPQPTPFAPAGQSITVRGLGKAFGQKEVLCGIDLDIPAEQFVAVIGKSGCGKSTLLRLLVGLDQPTAGSITFGGQETLSRIMFQEPRLLPWAKVAGNVDVGLGANVGAQERRIQAVAALRQVGLGDRADEWPTVLSGGQKQRVALARALVSRPQFLALDEPLGALDALTRISMQQLIERVWREQGFTAMLVTHDVSEAVALADRILVIDDGTIVEDIAIDQPRPRHRRDPSLAAIEGRILDRLFMDDQVA